VQGETRDYFYNPMWANFGDAGSTPPGTYFYDASGREVNYFWNMFDQILVRPALLPCLSTDSVSVVTEIEGDSLLDERGRPDREIGSDHLPVVLRLTEIEERFAPLKRFSKSKLGTSQMQLEACWLATLIRELSLLRRSHMILMYKFPV
jgi:hypothetical protein